MPTATATRAKKPTLDHLEVTHGDGCPGDRLESWTAARPTSKQYPLGGTVHRTRCLDCGKDAAADVTPGSTTKTTEETTDG